ncbi:MAG: ribosome recycling factor [Flavobacteriales bacterium]|jgi:ribosome recycling factor
MNEEVSFILDSAKEQMQKALKHLETEMLKIRAGKANPVMLQGIMVDYYGSMTALAQVANVGTPDARTLTVQPWEKAMIEPIEKAILNSNLGFNPMNNGDQIMINIPPLTEERRGGLAKQAKAECEHCKVSVRNARKDANDEIKKLGKDGLSEDLAKDAEAQIQKITDAHISKTDELFDSKEKDIMTI